MKLLKILKACKLRIGEGSEFLWKCYPDAYCVDFYSKNKKPMGSVTYNTNTSKVYEVIVESNVYEDNSIPYRWIDPEFRTAYNEECKKRGVDPNVAWDDVKFVDVTSTKDIKNILKNVFDGGKVTYSSTDTVEEDEVEQPNANTKDAPDIETCNCDGCSGCKSNNKIETNTEQENETMKYTVNILMNHEFEVEASSMEDATQKAIYFTENLKPTTQFDRAVIWNDAFVHAKSVTQTVNEVYHV
jgi:hypothetical protein